MTSRVRELRRATTQYRTWLAAGLAAAAVAAGLSALGPTEEPGVAVLTATRDLAPGVPLTAGDLVTALVPAAVVPAGVLVEPAAALGRLLAGPVRRGETLTDARLLGPGLLGPGLIGPGMPAGAPDELAVPVRVAEPATAALVRAGDRVDVLSASPEGGVAASLVATALRVLAVPGLGDAPGEGALLVLAADRPTAARLAAAAVTGRLSVAVLPLEGS